MWSFDRTAQGSNRPRSCRRRSGRAASPPLRGWGREGRQGLVGSVEGRRAGKARHRGFSMPRRLQSGCGAFRLDFDGGLGGEAEETALFLPVTRERRPLIASMLSWDPERNWFRIAKASLISSTRPALTSVSAPFPMTRRLPLPARRTFASINRTTGSRSGRWPLSPPAAPRRSLPGSAGLDPIGRDGDPIDYFLDKAF